MVGKLQYLTAHSNPAMRNSKEPALVSQYIFQAMIFFLNAKCFFFKIYLFIYGCVGSSFLCEGFLYLRRAGATLHRGVRASHYHGLSCCGAQAPDAQAQ